VIDAELEGGIDFCPITEIAGEAGVGKTQLLLSLLLTVQLDAALGGLAGLRAHNLFATSPADHFWQK